MSIPLKLKRLVTCRKVLQARIGKACMIVFSGFLAQASFAASCTVKLDDGRQRTIGTQACTAYYPSQHPCSTLSRGGSNGCAVMDMFTVVDWDGVDLINNTHRGVWGVTLPDDVALQDVEGDSTPSGYELKGAPENTIAGMFASRKAGFRSVEFDIFPMVVDDGSGPHIVPVVSHLADLAGFSSYRGDQKITTKNDEGEGFLSNLNTLGVTNTYYVRDRSGKLAYQPGGDMPHKRSGENNIEYKFVTLEKFLQYMNEHHSKMVVVLDLKWSKSLSQRRLLRADAHNPCSNGTNTYSHGKVINTCIGFHESNTTTHNFSEDEQVRRAILESIKIAQNVGGHAALSRIIFKVPQDRLADPATDFDAYLPEYPNVDLRSVMWAPQPDAGGNKDPQDVMYYVQNWTAWSSKNIAFWDTSLHYPEHWMAKSPFNVFLIGGKYEYDDTHYCDVQPGCHDYGDLMGFLKHISDRRPAVWVIDPAGPLGRNGNYGMTWTNYGNNEADRRGDIQASLAFRWSKNSVYTTDRPLTAVQIRTILKRRHGIIQ